MKVAVLGGSGFIGTRLVRRLRTQRCEIVIGDIRPSIKYPDLHEFCDIRQKDDLARTLRGADAIVNLAAVHRDDERPLSRYADVNVEGSRNVCDVATDLRIDRIVFTSSVAVYGFSKQEMSENHPSSPFNEYGKTKLAAEGIYRNWQTASPTRRLFILRPTVVFGEQNRGNFYELIKRMAHGKAILVGSGKNCKSVAYVENVAAALEFGMQLRKPYALCNYVDKPDLNMNALVSLINATLGRTHRPMRIPFYLGYLAGLCFDCAALITRRKFAISAVRVKKFCATTQFATDRIRQLGFQPPVPLDKAIEGTIRYEFPQQLEALEFPAAAPPTAETHRRAA